MNTGKVRLLLTPAEASKGSKKIAGGMAAFWVSAPNSCPPARRPKLVRSQTAMPKAGFAIWNFNGVYPSNSTFEILPMAPEKGTRRSAHLRLPPMKTELAAKIDLPAIERMRRETFAHFAPPYYTPREVENLLEDFDQFEALSMIEHRALFVAKVDGRIVACAGWHREHIRHIYVRPVMTGRQIGSTLLAYAEGDFRNRTGRSAIRANVIVYALGFYQKNGYRVISKEQAWDDSAYYRMIKGFHSL